MRMTLRLILACLGAILFTVAAFAQADRGTITGTITDPAGAVIANANVLAANSETGAQFKTVTTPTGNYTLAQLPAGVYSVTVQVAGFKRFIRQGVTVQVAQTAAIDIALEVGATSESVTVTADATLLKTESSDQSFNITSASINALPLNFGARGPNNQVGNVRSAYSFIALTPGGTISGQSDVRINGNPNNSGKVMVEGQESGNWQNGRPDQVQPSVEAIQEISTQTSNFAAEYGQVAGGLFNFTSKSGTNQFHGGAYDYFVNEFLNAGIPFTNNGTGSLVRPRARKNDFGGTLGGPLSIPHLYNGRDRTFFFFNMEMYRETRRNSGTLITVPTAAMRAGDFSAIKTTKVLNTDPLGRQIIENTIYDPATQRLAPNGAVVRDPFSNNFIPPASIDPVAAKIQALLPPPSNSAQVNNFEQIYDTFRYQYLPSVKVDHNFRDNSKLSVFWTMFHTHHLTGSVGSLPDALPVPITATRELFIRTHTFRLSYDRTISPTLLLHVGAGFMRQVDPDIAVPGVLNYDAVAGLGLKGGATNGFPNISGLSSSYGGMSNVMGLTNANYYFYDKPTGVASATYVRGSHTYKAGLEWRNDIFINRNTQGSEGVFAFGATESGLPSTDGQSLSGGVVGFPYASFLLGAVNNASLQSPQATLTRKMAWGLFIQDNWKLTRKLTLDYGLRWDYQTAPLVHDRMSMFGPTIKNPSAGGLLGGTMYIGNGPGRCNCSFTDTYPYAIGPRLGVAYQIDPKTVFRGGWGISYGATGSTSNFNAVNGIGGWNILQFTAPSYGDPAVLLRNGLQYNPADLYGSSLDPGLRPTPGLINNPPAYIDRNGGRPPRINQWSLGFQRQITTNLVVEAAYVGNRGVWFNANNLIDFNGLTPARLASFGLDITNAADRTLLTSRLSSSGAIARGFKAPYPGFPMNQNVAQSLRPFPQFGTLSVLQAPLGNSWYDSLQAKVTKRYSHGLTVAAAFTWQKELTTAEGVQANDVYNRAVLKGISPSSLPYILVTAFNYQTPSIARNKWMKQVLGGWTIGGLLRYQSGLPIMVPLAQNSLNSVLLRSSAGTFANRVPGQNLFTQDLNCHCYDPNRTFVLNPAAWSDPAAGQWGYSAPYYNDYRYQRRPEESLNFGRNFRIREAMSFNVRVEFYNVLNRTYANNPTSGNAKATQVANASGQTTSGFGYISTGSTYSNSRNGQIVARLQF